MTTNHATPSDEVTVHTSIRLPRESKRRLRVIAAQSDRNISEEIRALVEARIAEAEAAA